MAILDRVLVSKEKLLNAVRQNKEIHKKIWEETKQGYLTRCREKLQEEVKKFEKISFKDAELSLFEKKPSNHLADYDEAISMLEWTDSPSLELTSTQFKNYVLDEWSWSVDFYNMASGCYSKTANLIGNNKIWSGD